MDSKINRRDFLRKFSVAVCALNLPSVALGQRQSFSRELVLNAARALAAVPYVAPTPVPEVLLALDYSAYREIEYQTDAAIWGGTPTRFSIELFAPGNLYTTGVDISVVENGEVVPISLGSETFSVPTPEIGAVLEELGQVAGFRLHYPINSESRQEEFVVFQGASYFRAVSRGQQYGLSARGLAVDVAEPTGEEFPTFTRFWIERPSSRSDSIVVHALLDSPRVAGAYRFGIYPDDPTRIDIDVTLFARTTLTHVGLAPLTSMYLFGTMDRSDRPEYRNAVHDSTGLAMLTGQGEHLWRPLNNPLDLQVSSFVDRNPRGFGLAQRDREPDDFEDLMMGYHERPSAWVTPVGDWGEGHVVLVEIPTPSEANDNIVAYWRPARPLEPDLPFSFGYQLSWPDDTPLPATLGRVQRSAYGLKLGTQWYEVVIDYTGLPEGLDPDLDSDLDEDGMHFEVSFSNGVLVELVAQPNGPAGARLFVAFDPQGARMTEIRLQPMHNGVPIGETWLFRWLAS